MQIKSILHKDNLLNTKWIFNYASCIFNFITTRWYLISVTTKDEFWISLGGNGKTPQQLSALLQHDEEEDDSLETVAVSNWHYDTHLGINKEKEEVIGCIKPYQNRK